VTASSPVPPDEQREIEAAARRRVRVSLWNLLLILPLVATLIPGIYNRESPRLFSIPFFYWYQMACIPLGVLCVVLVFRNTRGER
jgi:uncharacterized membrane protein YhdT